MRQLIRLLPLWLLGCLLSPLPAAAEEVLFSNGAPNLWSATDIRRFMPAEDFVLSGEAGETVEIHTIEFWVMDYGAFSPELCDADPDMNCWSGIIEYAIFEEADKPDTEPSAQYPEGVSWSFLKRAPSHQPLLFESVDINAGGEITIEATGRVGENQFLIDHTEYRVSLTLPEPIELQAGTSYWLGLHMAGAYGPKGLGLYWETSLQEYRPGWCQQGIYETTDSEGNPISGEILDGGNTCQSNSECDVIEEGDGLGVCQWKYGTYEQRESYSIEDREILLSGRGSLSHLSTKDKFENFNDIDNSQTSQLAFNLVPEPGSALQALVILVALGSVKRRKLH